MINNAETSINWPINRINRCYWLLLAIIGIKCNNFIIVYHQSIAIMFLRCLYVPYCTLYCDYWNLSLETWLVWLVSIGISLFSMRYNSRTERRSTVLAKKANRNIGSCCQRKRSHVARVCTRRATGCWMAVVTVSCASACKFRVANDALETQCLYKTCTSGCGYRHGMWAPCYLRLETDLRHWVCGKREFRLKVSSRAHKYIQNTDE